MAVQSFFGRIPAALPSHPGKNLSNAHHGSFLKLLPVALLGSLSTSLTAAATIGDLYNVAVCHEPFRKEDSNGGMRCGSSHEGLRQTAFRIAPLILMIFCTPYWNRLGDTTSRTYPLIPPILASTIAATLTLLATLAEPATGVTVVVVVFNILAMGLSGGPALFQGSLLTYMADTSSYVSLFSKFCILSALNVFAMSAGSGILQFSISNEMFWISPFLLFFLSLALLVYIPTTLPDADELSSSPYPSRSQFSSTRLPVFHPKAWWTSVSEILQNEPALRSMIAALALVLFFHPLGAAIDWGTVVRLLGSDDPTAGNTTLHIVNLHETAKLLCLVVVALLAWRLFKATHTTLVWDRLRKISLACLVLFTASHLITLIAIPFGLGIVALVTTTAKVLTAVLVPSLLTMAFFLWEKEETDRADRSSFFGALALLQYIGTTMSSLLISIFSPRTLPVGASHSLVPAYIFGIIVIALALLATRIVHRTYKPDPIRLEGRDGAFGQSLPLEGNVWDEEEGNA